MDKEDKKFHLPRIFDDINFPQQPNCPREQRRICELPSLKQERSQNERRHRLFKKRESLVRKKKKRKKWLQKQHEFQLKKEFCMFYKACRKNIKFPRNFYTNVLSKEVLFLKILSYLNHKELKVISSASKLFYVYSNDNRIWMKLTKRNFFKETKFEVFSKPSQSYLFYKKYYYKFRKGKKRRRRKELKASPSNSKTTNVNFSKSTPNFKKRNIMDLINQQNMQMRKSKSRECLNESSPIKKLVKRLSKSRERIRSPLSPFSSQHNTKFELKFDFRDGGDDLTPSKRINSFKGNQQREISQGQEIISRMKKVEIPSLNFNNIRERKFRVCVTNMFD